MGLQQTITLDNGLSAENAYFKIDTYQGNGTVVSLDVKAWVSRTASKDGSTLPFWEKIFTFDYDLTSTENILTYGYTELKTSDTFSVATDVLES